MKRHEDFNALVEQAMTLTGHSHMRPVIEKELLHYDILFALDKDDLLDQLTFQGGTSLRLCYGAPRFSEDLDFACGKDFATASVMDIKNCLEKYIGLLSDNYLCRLATTMIAGYNRLNSGICR